MNIYNLAIISMFKNESLILEEWIKYYIDQGVQHFYLIDNGSDDNYEEKIDKYRDKITLIKDSFRVSRNISNKLKIYDNNKDEYIFIDSKNHTHNLLPNNYFLEKIRNETNWIMFIDCDEYIYISKKQTINDFLIKLDKNTDYDKVTDIFFIWKIFGSNDLQEQPKSIINGFNKRMDCDKFKNKILKHGNIFGWGKSITRSKHLKTLLIHINSLTTKQILLMPDYSIIERNNGIELKNFMNNLDYEKYFIHCNHYMIMSKEYFINNKIKRSGGAFGIRDDSYWKQFDVNDKVDNLLIEIYNDN